MRRRPVIRVVSALAVLAGLSGCIFNPPKDTGGGNGGLSYRPQNVADAYVAPLYNLTVAYKNRDAEAVEKYKEIIDKDLFQFRYYDPQSSNPTQPRFWNYSDDVTSTEGLLSDASVSQISLVFPLDDTASAVPSSVVGDPVGTKKFTINGIALNVQKGDILYQTTGSGDFYVAPLGGVYKIIRWEDNTSPPATSPRGPGERGGPGTLNAGLPSNEGPLETAARLAGGV